MNNGKWLSLQILLFTCYTILLFGAGHTIHQSEFWMLLILPVAMSISSWMWGDEVL